MTLSYLRTEKSLTKKADYLFQKIWSKEIINVVYVDNERFFCCWEQEFGCFFGCENDEIRNFQKFCLFF